ncbi:MAG: class I SAM-dependent methyltransferase [Patescibacteria group bacterium]
MEAASVRYQGGSTRQTDTLRYSGSPQVAAGVHAPSGVRWYVDGDMEIGYELHSMARRVFSRVLYYPIARLLPKKVGEWLFAGLSSDAHGVRTHATSHRALELIYTYPTRPAARGLLDAIATRWWFTIANARSVRNRLRLVKREVRLAILKIEKDDVVLMSLGSGSARAILEVLYELKGGSKRVRAILVDRSRSALDYSRSLAAELGVLDQIETVKSDVLQVAADVDRIKPDVVEMVGLLDYFDAAGCVKLIRGIHTALLPGAYFITGNIRDNPERDVVTRFIGWPMLYKSEGELGNILVEAEFRPQDVRIIYEPFLIHGVAVAKRNGFSNP